ncbi:peptidoglycan/xylan/chitin deacetylase (PgdA/CDA1 family) [Gramella sp. Hel_I_59]|uniref:polysaccharide deacetylase family protein n=1 Tax=Gramella sp. Hel_I_59 TaxID=1249978 RepID=UPI00114F9DEA|nr:polysaccharide deacetylase family protein [Gramella sp. Hel_I_59]TQI71999.1 peptidoglycan/xylan/chitin deacetylase (PgdA/CDA1 family) [Gramella sp. Hel_I_59]
MSLFLPKYPSVLKLLYPKRISRIKDNNAIYLTFDDGPIPEITPWVLNLLEQYSAKATFFCIGENVQKYPEIFRSILEKGHCVGNHTYNHLNGWKTSKAVYIENTEKTQQVFTANKFFPETKFFRPPYGKILNAQARELVEQDYKIVMWDVISGDYDHSISAEKCYRNVINNAVAGSTIVFHDSEKAFKNLREVLPRVMRYYAEKGFTFKSLTDAPLKDQ